MEYKVLYYVGESIDLKTDYDKGVVLLEKDTVYLVDKEYNKKEVAKIKEVELLRPSRVVTIIQVKTEEGNIFIAVYRVLVGNSFGVLNRGKTEELYYELNNYIWW